MHRVASQIEALSRASGSPVDLLVLRQHDSQQFRPHPSVRLVAEHVLPPRQFWRGQQFIDAVLRRKPIGVHPALGAYLASDVLATDTYDLVWVFKAELAHHMQPMSAKMVVDLDDVEAAKIRRGISAVAAAYPRVLRPLIAIRDGANARAWSRLQSGVVERADAFLVCAEADRTFFNKGAGYVVPNTVAEPHFDRLPDIPGSTPSVLFHGTLTYGPNADAVRTIVESIAPRVWRSLPDARFVFAGKYPDGLEATCPRDERLRFTGFVEDMWKEIERAHLVVAPIRYGGGTRVKLIEAAAAGKPIVSTSIGAEGLPFTDGLDILIEDEWDRFALAVCEVLGSKAAQERLGASSRKLFEEKLSSRAVAESVEMVVSDVLA